MGLKATPTHLGFEFICFAHLPHVCHILLVLAWGWAVAHWYSICLHAEGLRSHPQLSQVGLGTPPV